MEAINKAGKSSIELSVNVIDVSDAPQNLQVTHVNAKSCTLQWEKPSNDGGSKVFQYVVEKINCDDMLHGWTIAASNVKDCTYTADKLVKDRKYQFRLVCKINYLFTFLLMLKILYTLSVFKFSYLKNI